MKHFVPNCGLTLDDLILATHHQIVEPKPIDPVILDSDAEDGSRM